MTNSDKSKKFPRAGYKIHFDRLRDIRSPISAIRTHKFKCEIPKEAEEDLKKKFAEVSAVVDSSDRGSGMWFLIQMIGNGFLLPSAENKSEALLNALLGKVIDYGFPVPNQEGLKQTLMTGYDNIQNLQSALCDVWGVEESDELPKVAQEILSQIKETTTNNQNQKIGSKKGGLNFWVKEIFAKKLNCPKILEIKKEGEGIEKLLVFNPKFIEWNTAKVLSWVSNKRIDEISLDDDSYTWIFQNILPTLSFLKQNQFGHLAKKPIELINPYHALGKFLPNFRDDAGELKKILTSQIPEDFEKKSDLVDLLSDHIKNCAALVPLAIEKDFIAENWAKYRETNFSGRLSGWLSNFQNRLKLFEESLLDKEQTETPTEEKEKQKSAKTHAKVFEEIETNCDWERIFPAAQKFNFEKLRDLRADLSHALRAIRGEIESKPGQKDFGILLDEYNQYLQGFREFLMRWNNEGIPESFEDEDGNEFKIKTIKPFKKFDSQTTASAGELEISEELLEGKSKKKTKKNSEENGEEKSENSNVKIIGYWSRSFVPSELDRYPRFIGVAQKDPLSEIENARDSLFSIASESLQLVRKIREINPTFSSEKWLKGKKNTNHGLFQKNLESLKDLAERYGSRKNKHKEKLFEKSKSYKFFTQFIDLENTKSEEQKKNWSEKNLTSIKFFVTGYEYRNKQFLATKPEDFSDYLRKFEDKEHFGLGTVTSTKDVENWLGFQNNNISWFTNEHGEILKIYLSLLLRDLGKKIKLPSSSQNFQSLKKTTLASLLFDENGNLKSGDLDAAIVRRFFASSIGSEIRSKISILSRKDFIKRNVIQITNGGQSLLRYVPIEWGNFDHLDEKNLKKIQRRNPSKSFSPQALEILKSAGIEEAKTNSEIAKEIWKGFTNQNPNAQKKLTRVLAEIPHRWEVILKTKQPINSLFSINEGLLMEKSNDKNIFDFCTKKSDFLYPFPIQTSVYQKQFLDKFLWGDKKEILTEKIMGPSVIIEQVIDVRPNAHPKESKFSFYCAIPFQFSKEETRPEKSDENKGKYRFSTTNHENILGIDLGEYGFGWAVFNPKTEQFVESNFIEVPLLKKMRDEAASWKDTQASGIFSRPTTHLADIREQAAGQVRNQIHHLAMTHNARPVYEDSVDGFESGGQRVSKLYKTLKTSDVISGASNEADKIVRKHFWGSEYAQIGGVIGAAKTSQTCRCCGRCATSEISALEGDKVRIENESIVGTDIFCKKENGEFDKKEIEALVKKSQRLESEKEKSLKDSGKRERGSVSKFRCHICKYHETNLEKLADADEQAAQNIALKYFFMKSDLLKKEKEEFDKREEFKDRKSISLPFFLKKSKEEKYRTNTPN